MSREIKFRARIVFSGRWAYFGLYNNELLEGEIEKETLGQFTGLKDKNGKEIYEGDIARWGDDGRIAAIEWNDDLGTFTTARDCVGALIKSNPDKLEVIGNIYENPELLK